MDRTDWRQYLQLFPARKDYRYVRPVDAWQGDGMSLSNIGAIEAECQFQRNCGNRVIRDSGRADLFLPRYH